MKESVRIIELRGDASLTRNLRMGGSAHISGSAHIARNLRVDGWLEAKNIKGAIKGVFATSAELESVYPRPERGFAAIVGKNPMVLWLVNEQREWVNTGQEITLNVSLDSINDDIENIRNGLSTAFERIDEIELEEFVTLQHDLNEAKSKISTIEERVVAEAERIGELELYAVEHGQAIDAIDGRVSSVEETLLLHQQRISVVEDTLTNHGELLSTLENESARHEDDIETLRDDIASTIADVSANSAAISGLAGRLDDTDQHVSEVIGRIEQLESRKVAGWLDLVDVIRLGTDEGVVVNPNKPGENNEEPGNEVSSEGGATGSNEEASGYALVQEQGVVAVVASITEEVSLYWWDGSELYADWDGRAGYCRDEHNHPRTDTVYVHEDIAYISRDGIRLLNLCGSSNGGSVSDETINNLLRKIEALTARIAVLEGYHDDPNKPGENPDDPDIGDPEAKTFEGDYGTWDDDADADPTEPPVTTEGSIATGDEAVQSNFGAFLDDPDADPSEPPIPDPNDPAFDGDEETGDYGTF